MATVEFHRKLPAEPSVPSVDFIAQEHPAIDPRLGDFPQTAQRGPPQNAPISGQEGTVFARQPDFDRWPGRERPAIRGGASDEPPPEEPKPSESHQHPYKERDVKGLFESLAELYKLPALDIRFEAQLEEAGLLSGLEEVGILPVVENPNPFHLELEKEQFRQWADEHPEEMEKFVQDFEENFDKRKEVLRYLYVGAFLGNLFDVFSFGDIRQGYRAHEEIK